MPAMKHNNAIKSVPKRVLFYPRHLREIDKWDNNLSAFVRNAIERELERLQALEKERREDEVALANG